MSNPHSPTRFLLIRHAQTQWNHDRRYAGSGEVPLSDEAAPQIAHLTKYLKNTPLDAVYCSPLSRCIQTITPLAEHNHRRIIIREELRERFLGSWQGKSPEEIHPAHGGYHFPESAYNGEFRIPDAEPMEDLAHRVRTLLHELRTAHPGQTIALATHAGVIWMIQAHIVTNPPKQLVWPGNCQLTTVVTESNHYLLQSIQNLEEY